MNKHILIADDDAAIVAALDVLLTSEGYQTSTASTPEQVKFQVQKLELDLVLLDMNYHLDTTSGEEGLALLAHIRQAKPNLPVVVMTGWSSVELSVASMRQGANDFVQKPWDNERLLSILVNQFKLQASEVKAARLSQENQQLKQNPQRLVPFLAEDNASQELLQMSAQVAATDISLMLYGENGTGKSLLAQHIHKMSARVNGPFISVNMGAIPESLFESELFGHVKGAFTDAKADRLGRFALAQSGTLFLDEVANIPLSQQAKLLRVLESKEYEQVGSSKTQMADVRVICATNGDLPALCQQGAFRQDLLYRLTAMELTMPALRDRIDDILPLATSQLARVCQKYQKQSLALSTSAKRALLDYDWPGNVRELLHCIERAVVLCVGSQIEASDLRLTGNIAQASNVSLSGLSTLTLDEIEKHVIIDRLRAHDGQANAAADSLGLSRSAFYRRLDKYQIVANGGT